VGALPDEADDADGDVAPDDESPPPDDESPPDEVAGDFGVLAPPPQAVPSVRMDARTMRDRVRMGPSIVCPRAG
jgi:hypothetical protein